MCCSNEALESCPATLYDLNGIMNNAKLRSNYSCALDGFNLNESAAHVNEGALRSTLIEVVLTKPGALPRGRPSQGRRRMPCFMFSLL